MRYKELDGLRGIAALSVYFSHLIGVFVINSSIFDYLSNSPFHILWHGEAAVTLFFLLSGFVLTLPYIKNPVDLNMASFYLKRIFRIYPAFIFAVLLCIFLNFFLYDSSQLTGYSDWINEFWKWDIKEISNAEFFNTFILAGFTFNTKLFDPVIGTLRTEMIISFVLPFLIFIVLRLKLAFNLLFLFLLFFVGKDTLGIFYLGTIMAIFRNDILDYVNSKSKPFYTIIFFVTASILYTSRFSLNFIFGNQDKSILLMSILGCVFFLILAMKNGFFSYILNTWAIQFLGKISYSLYLLHFPILLIVCSYTPANVYLVFPISLIVTLLVSHLVYKFIELPFIQLGKRIQTQRLDVISNIFFKGLSIFDLRTIVNLKNVILKKQ
ncbi:acyltransferase family protein [Flavobacterium sp. LS2P90]|uniref:Acyltransferase family protein n=1 Tax=Flavobacterium xylosi TaxID=3230415 RepID=A0ABW6HZA2_9FLAO